MTTARTSPYQTGAAASAIDSFIGEGISIEPEGAQSFPSEPVWLGLRATGTRLWLDTGDLEGAAALWRAEFSALTTNNTLLYAEVRKGIYDDLVRSAARILGNRIDRRAAVMEIAFILNARHGLRLVERFGARVSVELHTDLAGDVEGTLAYARRYHRICPERFIVKVPFTAAGLIATRTLRQEGIPVNMTLGFSARQNHLAAMIAGPSFLNVFLGRIGAYIADNRLGSGDLLGEKVTLASQRALDAVNRRFPARPPVLQIAASMRSAAQVPALAGVDVHTMPLKVAEGVLRSPPERWTSRRGDDPAPGIDAAGPAREARAALLWEVDPAIERLAASLDRDLEKGPPISAERLIEHARGAGCGDLFPELSGDEQAAIAAEGKIPRHQRWAKRIARGEAAIDSLLNAAGLASFAADQKALDERVEGLL